MYKTTEKKIDKISSRLFCDRSAHKNIWSFVVAELVIKYANSQKSRKEIRQLLINALKRNHLVCGFQSIDTLFVFKLAKCRNYSSMKTKADRNFRVASRNSTEVRPKWRLKTKTLTRNLIQKRKIGWTWKSYRIVTLQREQNRYPTRELANCVHSGGWQISDEWKRFYKLIVNEMVKFSAVC